MLDQPWVEEDPGWGCRSMGPPLGDRLGDTVLASQVPQSSRARLPLFPLPVVGLGPDSEWEPAFVCMYWAGSSTLASS